jgi:hypothetical protein
MHIGQWQVRGRREALLFAPQMSVQTPNPKKRHARRGEKNPAKNYI